MPDIVDRAQEVIEGLVLGRSANTIPTSMGCIVSNAETLYMKSGCVWVEYGASHAKKPSRSDIGR
jgi:hypothetical protein